MKLCAAPPNEFSEFIATYFESCRSACPRLRLIAGKWESHDLIPGLSDFDTRFIAADATAPEEWAEMSVAIGSVHTDITRRHPRWARMLEHLPGVNVTFAELYDPLLYHPEIRTWTAYNGDPSELAQVREHIANHTWTQSDEYFHLRRFATYFGPYQRGIDPPINLGPFEKKYALHSRYMHYFTPPVQAAVSLALRRTVRGKIDALQRARELFPRSSTITTILEAIERHYEVPEAYEDVHLARIEGMLESYLASVRKELVPHITLIDARVACSPVDLKRAVGSLACDPLTRFFDTARYARFMRGRLLFFAQCIPWFETAWLIRNELKRMGDWFCRRPLIAWKEAGLEGGPTAVECEAFRRLAQIADEGIPEGAEKAQALAAANAFEPVHLALERLGAQLRVSAKCRSLL